VLRNTRDVDTKSAKWFVAGFGVAADERFTAVLDSITKAAAVQCGVRRPPTDPGGGDRRPRAEARAKVYKELGYRTAGMVDVNLTVARPMVKAQGHIVQLIGPDGQTMKTLTRYRK
jgi:hypothetical protein